MSETINITYLEDDIQEQELVEKVQSRIKTLGGLSVKRAISFDEYGADGLTPILEFPDGTVFEGLTAIKEILNESSFGEYVESNK